MRPCIIISWQGEENVNQTFDDELNFDVSELGMIYEEVEDEE